MVEGHVSSGSLRNVFNWRKTGPDLVVPGLTPPGPLVRSGPGGRGRPRRTGREVADVGDETFPCKDSDAQSPGGTTP